MIAGLGMAAFAAAPAFASEDRVSIGNDVVVADGTAMHDVVCILCSVRVHGTVEGDVVTVLGSVAVVNGDVAVVAGDLQRGADASVHGDTNVEAGRGWLLLPFAPILILIGIVWLIVWFAGRRRYTFPVYPQGRGF
jgi:hypothetical protein